MIAYKVFAESISGLHSCIVAGHGYFNRDGINKPKENMGPFACFINEDRARDFIGANSFCFSKVFVLPVKIKKSAINKVFGGYMPVQNNTAATYQQYSSSPCVRILSMLPTGTILADEFEILERVE